MTINELYDKLLSANRPVDFFGDIKTEDELKIEYRKYAKQIHPDVVAAQDKYVASEAFSVLNRLYNLGLEEFSKGVYGVNDPLVMYQHMQPLFEIDIRGTIYSFYEHVIEGEVANIFKGISDNEIVLLKLAIDPQDNSLINNEFDVLTRLRHQSFPYVKGKIKINDTNAILMREVKGILVDELLEQYPKGVPAEHVMWMLERMLSAIGYLHANCVVHGNIKPENVLIDKEIHNVSLLGFSFCIKDANLPSAHYQIVNENYTAPEVRKTATVLPSSDIYSIGKIAIRLLGGDVESGGMPLAIDPRVRLFVRRMIGPLSSRPNDAWMLWSELINIRNEVYGTQRFKKLN